MSAERESRNEPSGRVIATLEQKEAMFEWLRGIATGDSKDWRKAAIAMNELQDLAELRRQPSERGERDAALEEAAKVCEKPRIWDAARGMMSVVPQCREAAEEIRALKNAAPQAARPVQPALEAEHPDKPAAAAPSAPCVVYRRGRIGTGFTMSRATAGLIERGWSFEGTFCYETHFPEQKFSHWMPLPEAPTPKGNDK